MEKVIKLLHESPALYFATADSDGRPHVRPVSLMLERDGKLFFCTSDKTSLYNNLKHNPYAEISVMSAEYVWVRIAAKAVFSEDNTIKEYAIDKSKRLKALFGSANNPDFNIFYLAEGTATLYDYSGNPPQVFTF